jgi:hypothetical protein
MVTVVPLVMVAGSDLAGWIVGRLAVGVRRGHAEVADADLA